MTGKALVIGASGFLGSHVARVLAATGRPLRLLMRPTSDGRATADLDVERFTGDVLDRASLERAMTGCTSVFHGAVDTRAWLRDPAPLYRVNVEGLRRSIEAALATGVERFIHTSSFVTIGSPPGAEDATEDNPLVLPPETPHYIRSRVEAEAVLFQAHRDRGLPAVACCVGNTYGAGDLAPTPHGKLIDDVARMRMPFYWEGGGPTVGVVDAARALVQAERLGRAGERYIISKRYVSFRELFALAASAAGVPAPRLRLPLGLLEASARIAELGAGLRDRETRLSLASIRCSRAPGRVSSAKARRELDWTPRPIEESIREAIDDYRRRRRKAP